ncbi:helix-turn-helix domain-containing protein [Alteromonas australica]|uniref:helix-turn-helix domain-containing protein n=1 Tax=Alteromonas australica TaxID=589873 RepID=UPI00235471EF|nr:helix-turn-helix domain-containing protein [Alteromonas australica]|tara:strand:- start:1135 stop:1353 length:219 start_codon:yes stop_codon:yes gene_type:complete
MSAFITTKQAAAYLNCTPQHLYNLRNKRKSAIEEGDKTLANKLAPEAIKIGGKLLFEESKLESWLRNYGEVA